MIAHADSLLQDLADAAGLLVRWRDARGLEQIVAPDTLRAVLRAMEIPCESASECRDSLRELDEVEATDPTLYIARVAAPMVMHRKGGSLHYRMLLEDGTRIMGTAQDMGGGKIAIPGVRRPGHHLLEMGSSQQKVAVVPHGCPSVEGLLARDSRGSRGWVLGAQIYSLRRGSAISSSVVDEKDVVPAGWEVGGDFALLRALATQAAEQGAAGMAISPVHAMFTADPGRYSPYSPSSRLFLNAMYSDPTMALGAEASRALLRLSEGHEAVANGCMDWLAIQVQRVEQLRRVFQTFDTAASEDAMRDFLLFRRQGGEALRNHACYEALHEHFTSHLGPGHGWQDWPPEYHDPAGESVRRFAHDHEPAIRFHIFLQWLAARSLAAAQSTASGAMPLGLIGDLAVGTDPRGSHAWSRQGQIMRNMSMGAPPDIFQPDGQNWGLTAFSPRALEQHGYEGFIETLRAVLGYAGGIRVDHAMGLARMWLVPSGAKASEGVYLLNPRDQLMDLLMLEAWRHEAVVVGENLGTVPDDFNDAMMQRGMLGMSVLWFEQEGGDPPAFRAQQDWPTQSMAMITTHDLPTLHGWWSKRDIEWRHRQGELAREQVAERQQDRETQKQALWSALQTAKLVASTADMPERAPAAEVLSYVAGTPSLLCSVALEDLLGVADQPNLPGAVPEGVSPDNVHPNWLRVLDQPVDTLLKSKEASRLLSVVREARKSPQVQLNAATPKGAFR